MDQVEQATIPPDDARAELAAVFDQAEKEQPAEVIKEETPETAEEKKLRNPNRDPETGKFASAPKEPKEQPIKAVEAPPPVETAAPETPKVEAPRSEAVAEQPPVSWAADAKAEWSKLPPAAQKAVLKREKEASDGIRQYSEQTRRYEQMIAPIAQAALQEGLETPQAINALVSAHYQLKQNAPEAIARLCQQYGVDPRTLGAIAQGSPQPSFVDPRLDNVMQWISEQESQRVRTVEMSVDQFATSPGHEHFDEVQNELMALIPQIKAVNPGWSHEKILQDAYDRAVYANPSTRAKVLASQKEKDEAERIQAAKAHAANAKRASASVHGAPNGAMQPTLKGTVEEELRAAWDAR